MINKLVSLLSGPNQQTVLIILIGIGLFFTMLPIVILSIRDAKKHPKKKKNTGVIDFSSLTPQDSERAETMAEVKAMLDVAKKQ